MNFDIDYLLTFAREAGETAIADTEVRVSEILSLLGAVRSRVAEVELNTAEALSPSAKQQLENITKTYSGVINEVEIRTVETQEDLAKGFRVLQQNAKYVTIAIFGRTRTGKSTFLEALTRGDGSTIGHGRQHTTKEIKEYFWPPNQETLRIVDTPGVEGFEGEALGRMAQDYVERSDHVFFLVSDDKATSAELDHFGRIHTQGKGLTVLLNMKQRDQDLDLLIEAPEELFDETRLAQHKDRILGFLEKNYDITSAPIIPMHARAAWLSSQPDCPFNSELLFERSNFSEVLEQIGRFVEFQAVSARVESPRGLILSHLGNLIDFFADLRNRMIEERKATIVEKRRIERALDKARTRASTELQRVAAAFRMAETEIVTIVDSLIHQEKTGADLRLRLKELYHTHGIDDVATHFEARVTSIFAEELEEEVAQIKFDRKSRGSFDTTAEEVLDNIQGQRSSNNYKRVARAGMKTLGGVGTGALATWGIANFWNPSGWVALAGAAVLTAGAGYTGYKVMDLAAEEWAASNRREFAAKRGKLIQSLTEAVRQEARGVRADFQKWLDEDIYRRMKADIAEAFSTTIDLQNKLIKICEELEPQLITKESQLETDVVEALGRLTIPELADGRIHFSRAVRQRGYGSKILVSSGLGFANSLGACIGKKGTRARELRERLGVGNVAFVEEGVDLRTQVAMALQPARVDPTDVYFPNERVCEVRVEPNQRRIALGPNNANVLLAAQLLQIHRINIV